MFDGRAELAMNAISKQQVNKAFFIPRKFFVNMKSC